jgi:hypothetical protein
MADINNQTSSLSTSADLHLGGDLCLWPPNGTGRADGRVLAISDHSRRSSCGTEDDFILYACGFCITQVAVESITSQMGARSRRRRALGRLGR